MDDDVADSKVITNPGEIWMGESEIEGERNGG